MVSAQQVLLTDGFTGNLANFVVVCSQGDCDPLRSDVPVIDAASGRPAPALNIRGGCSKSGEAYTRRAFDVTNGLTVGVDLEFDRQSFWGWSPTAWIGLREGTFSGNPNDRTDGRSTLVAGFSLYCDYWDRPYFSPGDPVAALYLSRGDSGYHRYEVAVRADRKVEHYFDGRLLSRTRRQLTNTGLVPLTLGGSPCNENIIRVDNVTVRAGVPILAETFQENWSGLTALPGRGWMVVQQDKTSTAQPSISISSGNGAPSLNPGGAGAGRESGVVLGSRSFVLSPGTEVAFDFNLTEGGAPDFTELTVGLTVDGLNTRFDSRYAMSMRVMKDRPASQGGTPNSIQTNINTRYYDDPYDSQLHPSVYTPNRWHRASFLINADHTVTFKLNGTVLRKTTKTLYPNAESPYDHEGNFGILKITGQSANGPALLDNISVTQGVIGVPPSFTTAGGSMAEGTVGALYGTHIIATGDPAPVLSLTSASRLPPGLVLDSASGAISGVPTASGTYSFTVLATNKDGSSSRSFSITVRTPPASFTPSFLTPAGPLVAGYVGQSYSAQILVSGYPRPSFSLASGTSLPSGLSLSRDTGVISGTPAAGQHTAFDVTASNSVGTVTRRFTISIAGAAAGASPNFATQAGALPGGAVGASYYQVVSATGSPAPTYALARGTSLPPGVLLDPLTGAISGIPTQAGAYAFTVAASNANGQTERDFSIDIGATATSAPPQLLTRAGLLLGARVGEPYEFKVAASGIPAPRYELVVGSALPPGLSLDPLTGLIAGTPTASGTYSCSVLTVNEKGQDLRSFTIDVANSSGAVSPAVYFGPCATVAGQPASLQLHLANATGIGLSGVSFELDLEPSSLTNVTIATGPAVPGEKRVSLSRSASGTIVATIAGGESYLWDGPLLQASLVAAADALGPSRVKASAVVFRTADGSALAGDDAFGNVTISSGCTGTLHRTVSVHRGVNLVALPLRPCQPGFSSRTLIQQAHGSLVARIRSGSIQPFVPGLSPAWTVEPFESFLLSAPYDGSFSVSGGLWPGVTLREDAPSQEASGACSGPMQCTLTLQRGLNGVALPLRPCRPLYSAEDLLRDTGAAFVARAVAGRFDVHMPASPSPWLLEGGQGYLVSMPRPATVTLAGDVWP